MVPLMMEEGYRPTGWLGLILGARLWYPFYGSAIETDAGFTQQMETVVRDIGPYGFRWRLLSLQSSRFKSLQ